MKTKIVQLSVAIILALGIAGGVYWWSSRPQVITFSDDSQLTLLGVDYGKRHAVPGGKLPKATARPATAATRGRVAASGVRTGNGSFQTPEDTLVLWVRAKYDYAPNQPGQPSQFHNFQFYVYDPADTACGQSASRNVSGNQQGDDILALLFNAFPRREGKVVLRAMENYSGGQEMAEGTFTVPNPAAKKSFTKWTADPLPSTKEDGDLAMTLTKLVAGADMPYQRNSDNPDDAMNKGVQVAYHVERAGQKVTNWQPASVETSDATGNRATVNYGPIGASQVQWQGDEGTFTYQYGLWPDEAAWRVRLEMTQTSDFSSDEQWAAQNIPVVPGSQQSFNNIGRRGAPAGRGAAPAPATAPPQADPTPCAETDLGGHHIKIFPAVQFTNNLRSANMPANYQPPQQTGFLIQVQPALVNTGIRPVNAAGSNATQPAADGMRLTLASVTDSQGGEIQTYNSGSSSTGMGSTNSTSIFRFTLRDTAGVTNISATIALHKNRFFEFTVKPEKAAAPSDQ